VAVNEATLPSFESSQFDIILRRQRRRPADGGVKAATVASRFLHLSNEFEFAGWGSLTRLKLEHNSEEVKVGEAALVERRRGHNLGQFTASSLAGNAVLGSVFYALPAVVGVSSV
jgi:hypothetical protein